MRPLLFLDIDGVLSPAEPLPDGGFESHEVMGYPVNLSSRHGEWLAELAAVYELCWATTWEDLANKHIAPLLDLPELPVVHVVNYHRQPGDPRVRLFELISGAKWAPLLRYAAGRPFAWVDDVIPPRLVRNSLLRRDRLLLPIDARFGLQRYHVDRLLNRPPRRRLWSGPGTAG
jgi:hypothetical protein